VRAGAVALAVLLLTAAGCEGSPRPAAPATSAMPTTTTGPTTTTTTTTGPSTTAAPAFAGDVLPIDAAVRARMPHSWRPGCPVGLEDLRLLRLRHWGFDGAVHDGELVVHADVADDVVGSFRSAFDARFPIERMELVDAYGADDDRSMAANNTSAFNCRRVAGTDRWSEHAYGRAVDINPIQNPYVRGSSVDPPAGAAYADRSDVRPGMLTVDGPVVRAFTAIGWGWGGTWTAGKDYQHLSASGR
jgi:hypothetical protein